LAIIADRRLRGAVCQPFRTIIDPRVRIVRAAALAVLLAACAGTADGDPNAVDMISVVDDAGRTVLLERPARRVISMIPAQTEIVKLLAGADALIARTEWDDDPALAHLPSVGNALTPSVEWLAAQRPDLIIAWPDAQSRDVVRRLTDIGIPVYASRVESVAEIREMIRRLGALLGVQARADSMVAALDADLEAVRSAVAGRPERSVLYLLNVEPPMVAGPGTFVDDLITLAGGRNVFADAGALWPQVSMEEIVRRGPDVIIRPTSRDTADPAGGLAARPVWADLDAVRGGRTHAVDADLFNRAGVSVAEAARGLAARIHPGSIQP
jgi:iron complex transport system substrate-binding protein